MRTENFRLLSPVFILLALVIYLGVSCVGANDSDGRGDDDDDTNLGACCSSSAVCSVMTMEECSSDGGVQFLSDTKCYPNPCGVGDDDDDNDDNEFTCNDEVCLDSSTGLIWQKNSISYLYYEDARSYCIELELDKYKDWRLPTLGELRGLIRGCPATGTDGDCGVTEDCLGDDCWNDSCEGCESDEGPAYYGQYLPTGFSGTCYETWSSSPFDDNEDLRWYVDFRNGAVDFGSDEYHVKCVR